MVSAAYSLDVTRHFALSTGGVILAEAVVSRFNPGPAVGVFDPCGFLNYMGCFSAPRGLFPQIRLTGVNRRPELDPFRH